MVSRTQRTPFARLVVDGRPPDAGRARRADARRHHPLAGASSPVATKLGLDPFHFVNRQIFYLIPAIAIMLVTSLLSPRQIRRLALVVFAHQHGVAGRHACVRHRDHGARRWIVLLGVNIQPSEFVKPAFVILIAWLFGEVDAQAGNAG